MTASEHAAFYPRNGSLAFGMSVHKMDMFTNCCRMLVVDGVCVEPLIVISLLFSAAGINFPHVDMSRTKGAAA